MRTASRVASKQWDGVLAATIGSGASPWRPYMAWRRSACSVLVGRPVDGPPRWMSMISSGSSRLMARPIISAFRSMPGPEVVVTPRAPPKAAPEGGADARDLVLGLEGAHTELLVLGQLVEDVRGRGDRVGPEEQRQPAAQRCRHQAPGGRRVAGHIGVLARLENGRLDLVGGLEQLGRLAEVVAGLEGPEVGLLAPVPCRRTSRRSSRAVGSTGRV